jgi:hypothetical protein
MSSAFLISENSCFSLAVRQFYFFGGNLRTALSSAKATPDHAQPIGRSAPSDGEARHGGTGGDVARWAAVPVVYCNGHLLYEECFGNGLALNGSQKRENAP